MTRAGGGRPGRGRSRSAGGVTAGSAPGQREARLTGWDAIAAVLAVHPRTAMRHRAELRDRRAIFYQWLGRPPRKTVCSYESVLRDFLLERE